MVNSSTSNSEAAHLERQMAKRFIFRFATPFLLVVALVAVLWDWALSENVIFKTETHGAAKLQRIGLPHKGEVPIIGSSRALGSYIPDSLFENAFNYGVNGIGYRVMDLFLERELSSGNTAPILVNFDFQMFMGSGGDPSTYLPHSLDPEVWALMGELNLREPYYRVPGLRLYGCLDAYMREFLNQRLQVTKWVTKGAALEKNVLPKELFDKLVQQRLDEPSFWSPDTSLTALFSRRLLQGMNREWLIAVAPYHWSFYKSFAPGGLEDARKYLRDLDAMPNVRVFEVSGAEWPDSLFANTTHINLKGAVRFNQELRGLMHANDSLSTTSMPGI